MSNILVIPDIHGRSFWKEPCKNWEGRIVFLGDYHDPYGEYIDGEPNKHDSLVNLRELAEFVSNRRKNSASLNTICLMGNHDCSYYTGNLKCRYDRVNEDEVKQLLKIIFKDSVSNVTYELWTNQDRDIYDKFLFSHAGVTQNWLDINNLTLDSQNKDFSKLEQVPYSRGGHFKYGSCIWNSLEDFQKEEHIPGYYQIFGHTWGGRTEPVIEDDYAMLDCCRAFVLDTTAKEIVPWTR